MSTWKTWKLGKKNIYQKDGRTVKSDTVPPEVVAGLEHTNPLDDTNIPEAPIPVVDKSCVFCGMGSRMTRLVNMQTVYICDQHYYDKTIGKIAERLRELKTA